MRFGGVFYFQCLTNVNAINIDITLVLSRRRYLLNTERNIRDNQLHTSTPHMSDTECFLPETCPNPELMQVWRACFEFVHKLLSVYRPTSGNTALTRWRKKCARVKNELRGQLTAMLALSSPGMVWTTPVIPGMCVDKSGQARGSGGHGFSNKRACVAVLGDGVSAVKGEWGLGLMAQGRTFRAGDVITQYCGEVINIDTAKARMKSGKGSHLCSALFLNTAIDGWRIPLWGAGGAQFANMPLNANQVNSKFKRDGGDVFLVATKTIASGQYVYVSYGDPKFEDFRMCHPELACALLDCAVEQLEIPVECWPKVGPGKDVGDESKP